MDKNGVVTFSEWNKGQVNHPVYGFSLLKNVEVFENLGVAKLKNRKTSDTTITPTQLPIAECYDNYGNTYTLTGETGVGTCYKNGVSIQGSLTNAWDIKIYKNYLWCRYNTTLAAYGPLDAGGAAWFNINTGFNTVGATVQYYDAPILIGQDDFMYIGNGNYVAKVEVTASGTVGVAPTLSVNLTALDLPDGQYVSCLEEYGTKIGIGTHGGPNGYSKNNTQTARLYFWNRQLGTLGNPGLADLPIIFSENGVNAIKQHANKLYVSAGTRGNIYVTDSTNYVKIVTLPYTQTGFNYSSTVYKNALDINPAGNLLVGVSGDLNTITSIGIYEINLNTSNYPVSFTSTSSYTLGSVSTPTQYKIGFVNPINYQNTRVGYANGTTFKVDITDITLYSSYGGVIYTKLEKVGDTDKKHTFQHIQWELAEPLVSGQNIRISYRKNNQEDFTLIDTWGYATEGGVISFADTCAIADCEYIQLKIELDQSTLTLYGSNIYLIKVKLW